MYTQDADMFYHNFIYLQYILVKVLDVLVAQWS